MNDSSYQVSSPKSVESGSSNSKFKTLKKKIRNKFRLSRGEDVKTIAQAVETLKRSDELLAGLNDNPDQIKNEFKELKNTLESIVSQNQVLAEVMKSVDSCCPDPFNEPEKFSVYFAQKSINSLSDEFEDGNISSPSAASSSTAVGTESSKKPSNNSVDVENALVRLQNLRMEEQRGFQIERENFETRLAQLSLLQQEIEMLRKQNSEHEIQIEFLKSQNCTGAEVNSEIESLRALLLAANEKNDAELSEARAKIDELTSQNSSKDEQLNHLNETIETLTKELETVKEAKDSEATEYQHSELEELKLTKEQLQGQLEHTLLQLKTLQESLEGQEEKERQFRELSEENVRIKIEFGDLKKELAETRTQLADLEKEPISSVALDDELTKTQDESAFKYVYLSNLVLKFLQYPEQRTELGNIILTTLQTDQPHFKKAMNMQ